MNFTFGDALLGFWLPLTVGGTVATLLYFVLVDREGP